MNEVTTILQPAEMEQTRSPRKLCDWVEWKAAELCQTKEGKDYACSGASLPKKLWEELRPFGLFALFRYGANGARCTPTLSNDNYDGKIEFSSSSIPPIYVELTYAKDGHDERLRLKVLSTEGSANWSGRVTVTGTKASGQTIEIENEMADRVEVRNTALKLLDERLAGKENRQYGRAHVLVVIVDDYIAFRTDEDKEALVKHAQCIVPTLKLDFGAVYLLGSSGKYCARILGEI